MRGLPKTLLVLGLLTLAALTAGACNGESTDGGSAELRMRIVRLEAGQMLQERLIRDQQEALSSQMQLNRSFKAYMLTTTEHAQSVDRTLTKQSEAMALLNSILMDLIKKTK